MRTISIARLNPPRPDKHVDKKLFAELVESMTQMNEIVRGERAAARVFRVEAVGSIDPSVPYVTTGRSVQTWTTPALLRTALLVVTIGAGLVALWVAGRSAGAPFAGIEPQLVFLLRGMALIKASAALAAGALAFWRFGRTVSVAAASGYIAGVACLVAATVLIWYLVFIAAAAIIFHVGLVGLLILAWREGRSLKPNDRLRVRVLTRAN